MNGIRIHVDTIIDTTWIPRENFHGVKNISTWYSCRIPM